MERFTNFRKSKERERGNKLKKNGYSILQFDNEDILHGLPNVKRTLELFIDEFESKQVKITPKSPQGEN